MVYAAPWNGQSFHCRPLRNVAVSSCDSPVNSSDTQSNLASSLERISERIGRADNRDVTCVPTPRSVFNARLYTTCSICNI